MKCTGSISVPIPPDDAIALFTPEGERAWVPNWEPQHHSDSVFTTAHAIWVVLDSEPRAVRYARVTPGVHAGTVEVRCHADGAATRAEVTYDLAPLTPGALDQFAEGYDAMLAEWERRIGDACTASR
jgi:hypothetical protein